MGIFDKAKDALGDNIEQVDAGIAKAADFVDDKTGNKYTEQIDQGAEFVKDKLEDFADDDAAQASDIPVAPADGSASGSGADHQVR